MAKGQKRSGREPKKAKAPPKKAAPEASIFSEPRNQPTKKPAHPSPSAAKSE
ncbi:hypothetical protein [Paramagnetospirillum magnetotacticum]|uniref:hypothetical protein n=1 Tax=Paramagnetospirillum magnetotacticum TaxID=188 RepID=UPI00042606D1|nr:hypothetical protein [Paramagnetospirillum magnetotacticum]